MTTSVSVKYIVMNENTLGHRIGADHMGVLAATKDGYDWKNGPVCLSPLDAIRPATFEDFEKFRVDAEGFKRETFGDLAYLVKRRAVDDQIAKNMDQREHQRRLAAMGLK